ncbi:DUF1643 domain-containing protein [Pasteurella canis]|uniref:DUF1643 domain-containing protein n=1 Tax=Pasteurella canis TaxID=753 RepID=UPI001D1102AB|nr:DUF1643 domain-containing protein [Pasteurella canis]UDW83761.1 DUF1643 domain-containing protein [Pasteurella canis]
MLAEMNKNAIFSNCRTYRYVLWRIWEPELPKITFIGLNPSTADESEDDPTIRRCINFAKKWGYGGIYMVNLFAYRSTDKSLIYQVPQPIGQDNDKYILQFSQQSEKVIAAWGNTGSYLSRSQQIYQMVPNLYCLAINKTSEPKHPLYTHSNSVPQRYKR